jgi:cyclomaltodextrinase / maltogenic alpha-amylase / neopullulanase
VTIVSNQLLYHHSHQSFYRSPFGAVPVSEKITLRLSGTMLTESQRVSLRVWREAAGEEIVPMHRMVRTTTDIVTWEVKFNVSDVPGLVWYYFIADTPEGIRYYGNNAERLGGQGQMQTDPPNSWQITVHQPDLKVPEWYTHGIMYQIFPDRFCNGLRNGKIRSPKKNCMLYSDWEDDPVYIKDPATGNMLKWDFHGGNFEGIIKKLPYLKSIGVTILYLNPIFEAASNHRYDTGDYKKIDPMVGTDETFELLREKAASLGMHLILDGVFSHTGSDSLYFNRYGNYDTLGAYQSKTSHYYPWYRFRHHPDDYDSWWGIENMPNTNELEHSFSQFIIDDEDSVIKSWIKKGAAGWRLDVADELPPVFIQKIRKAMKEIKPESVLIGEVWEDASNKTSYGERRRYLLGEELDSVMNYPFREILIHFFLGKISGSDTHRRLMNLYENYPRTYFYSCMNLVGTHDRVRILTILGEAPDEGGMTLSEKLKYKLPDEKLQTAVARMKMLVLFQMTFPGVPSIYYGDEAGMEGFSDPLNRRTYPWGRENMELLEWTKKVSAFRHKYPVLITGEWEAFSMGESHLAYIRSLPDKKPMLVIFNRHSYEPLKLEKKLPWKPGNILIDLLTETEITTQNDFLSVEIAPLSSLLLKER